MGQMRHFLLPIPGNPGLHLGLSPDLRDAAIASFTARLQKLGREVTKTGEQLDRLTDETPQAIRTEKRDRYLTAVEQFCDARDTLARLGVQLTTCF
jgi:ABC-type transporter Mla subunit MlaD